MKKTSLIFLSLLTSLVLISITSAANAASNTLEVSPASFVIQENDIGKKSTITIKNNSDKEINIIATECLSERKDGVIVPLDKIVEKEQLDIENPDIKIKANSEGTINARVKISAKGGTTFPCLTIKQKEESTNELTVSGSIVVPFLIQDFNGTQKFDLNIDLGQTGIITDPSITINGKLTNTGEKFFSPQGTIVISKDGTKLGEIEITSQVKGLMMTGESKNFSVKWKNELQNIASIGEYKIEVKISTDQSSTTSVKQILFNYVPFDIILLFSVIGIALLLIIIGVIIFKKR
jgi:hypothetical protein